MKTWIDPVVNTEPPVAVSESFAEFQKRIIEQMCNSLSIPKDILSQSNANYSSARIVFEAGKTEFSERHFDIEN